ncbi:MAG: MarR family winged helix-turn-helix transcriptional regulator [Dehalococcoidales bacterium]
MDELSAISNYDLWMSLVKVHHSLFFLRQKELSPSHIAAQQLQVLRVIQSLGAAATLSAISQKVERKLDVISRQAVRMEKDGLIKRVKDSPKSRLLRIELTAKGLDMLKISRESESINAILSVLTEEERRQIYSALNKILFRLGK